MSLAAKWFSLSRFWAVAVKEFIQMRRDRLTLGMMVGIPVMQLLLFGFAINSDPRHMSTAVLSGDDSVFSRAIVSAMRTSTFFDFCEEAQTRAEADRLLLRGQVQFILTIPERFGENLLRGQRPVLLLEADATDPAATNYAISAFGQIVNLALERELRPPLAHLKAKDGPVDIRVHAQYNPEGITQYNVVPGLMGVILTLTLIIITGLAITREQERGTMENLLSTPVRPLEVMLGKIIPYILVGYVQISLIVGVSRFVFNVPIQGNLAMVFAISILFIAANLSVGLTFSTIARNQLQAMQLSIFFFLPSMLLSGFMFPFRGMPQWAQAVGSILPLTHYLRFVRGVMLKGAGLDDSWVHVWPIGVFLVVVLTIGLIRYRNTLE